MCVCACVCLYVCVRVTPACKHDISRREAWTDLIFGMYVYHIKYNTPVVFVEVKGHLISTVVNL